MRFLVLVVLVLPLFARDATLSFRFPGGVDKVEFDDTKFSETQVRTIFPRFSPELAPFNGYMIAPDLGLCTFGDERHGRCGDTQSRHFLRKLIAAEGTIKASEDKVIELKDANLPEELEPVRSYLEDFLTGGLRIEKCQLEYYKAWNRVELEACDADEGAQECDAIVGMIARTSDFSKKHEMVQYDWHNCVANHQNKRLGPYPEEVWKKFLETHWIQETIFEQND